MNTITLPAREFLDRYILTRHRNSQSFATLSIDSLFERTIIEWIIQNEPVIPLATPSPDCIHHGEQITITKGGNPDIRCVWLSVEWRAHDERQQFIKQQSEIDRIASHERRYIHSASRVKLALAMKQATGLDFDGKALDTLVESMIKTCEHESSQKLMKFAGISLDELKELAKQ